MDPSLCKQVHKVHLPLYIGLYSIMLLLLVLNVHWTGNHQPSACAFLFLVSQCRPAQLVPPLPQCHTDVIVTAKPSVQQHCVACLVTHLPYMRQPSAVGCPAEQESEHPDAAAIGFSNGSIVSFGVRTEGGDDAVLGGSGSWRGHLCATAVCLDPRLHRRLLKCLLQGFG